MKKDVSVTLVFCSSLFLAINGCSETTTTQKSSESFLSKPLVFNELLNIRSYAQFCAATEQFKDYCGLCGSNKPDAIFPCSNPFGEMVHFNCLKMVDEIECSSFKGCARRAPFADYNVLHKVVIWFVMKLCSPQTIAEFHQERGRIPLNRYFNSARDLAVRRYLEFLFFLDGLNKKGEQNFADEICQDKKKFLAGLLLGESCLQKIAI